MVPDKYSSVLVFLFFVFHAKFLPFSMVETKNTKTHSNTKFHHGRTNDCPFLHFEDSMREVKTFI